VIETVSSSALLETGCKLTDIEYEKEFSSLLQNKFRAYPKFEVITGKFEATEPESNTYDLIFSASVFHRITEVVFSFELSAEAESHFIRYKT